MKKKKEKKAKKSIISILERELLNAGYNVERHNWGPNDNDDKSEWLDIVGGINHEKNKQLTVHMYFEDGTTLTDLEVWESVVKIDYDSSKQVFKK